MRQYLKNYNRMNSAMLKSETRIETHRRYNRLSEDPINGVKALAVRRQLRDLAIYNDNLSSSKELFNAAEKNLSAIADEMYIKFEEDIVAATNGTHEQMELDIYAQSFDQLADEMIDRLNGDFAERRVFGGTNNSSPAFRIETAVMNNSNDEDLYNNTKLTTSITAEQRGLLGAGDQNIFEGPNDEGIYTMKSDISDTEYNALSDDYKALFDAQTDADGNITGYTQKELVLTETQFSSLDKYDQLLFDSDTEYYIPDENGVLQKVDKNEYDASDDPNKEEKTTYSLKKNLYLAESQKERLSEDIGKVTNNAVALNSSKMTGVLPVKTIVYPPNWEEFYEYDQHGNLNVKKDEDGNDVRIPRTVTYNGIPVNFNALEKDADGNFVNGQGEYCVRVYDGDNWDEELFVLDPNEAQQRNDNSLVFPGSKPILVDIGIGIKYNVDGTVDEQTALDIALNGASITGSGMDNEGYSQNLIQLILDSAYSLYKGDQDTANAIIDKANTANNHILTEITTLGTKQNSIDFYLERNEDYELNLDERQNVVEGTDMNEEITHWYNVQAAWDASLKMSSSTLPTSIFDFI